MSKELLSHLSPSFCRSIQHLSKSTKRDYFKKLENESNVINFLSLLSEVKFGTLLNVQFNNISYERKINGLKPDWYIHSNHENIIFEVLRLNPQESVVHENIANINEAMIYKSFSFDTKHFYNQYSKIKNKLKEQYLNLVRDSSYKYIICIDARSEDVGILAFHDFYSFFIGNKNGYFYTEPDFKYVDGIAFLCHFSGENYYLKNPNSNYNINDQNTQIMKKVFLSPI